VVDRAENIVQRGVRHRMRYGWISLAVAGALVALLIVIQPARFYRLILGIPVGIAALSFMESREKTCVVLATLGKRETDEPSGVCDLAANERAPVRRQALSITIRATLVALAVSAIALAV
jgi:hypothetical protein